jgi:glyoxylase-like metal-dependent hydrolase (beta-lactamase superfamily II)
MRIHHLNCGTLRPILPRVKTIVYVLLVETNQGPVLIDTGLGSRDYASASRKLALFLRVMGVRRDPKETAAAQVRRLGFSPEAVGHIVLTHMHFDHAGGMFDFPQAQVHVSRVEFEAAVARRGALAVAYEPEQWAHGPRWVLHESWDRDWYGFRAATVLQGLVPEILLIPLPGHTRGHCGVAIQQPGGWLLQCGDAASPFHPEADLDPGDTTRHALRLLPRGFVERAMGTHVARLRALAREHGDQVTLVSAHDIFSFDRHRVS